MPGTNLPTALLLAAIEPGFQPFSAAHFWTVAGCGAVIVAVVGWGKKSKAAMEKKVRRGLGWFCLVVYAAYQVWLWLPQNFDWPVSLPLEFCDMGMLVGAFALLRKTRWLRGLLYFWTFVFTLQAFVTPVLHGGPDTVDFWLFWAAHTAIEAAAVYDLVVGKFRPGFEDLVRSYLISIVYAGALLILDVRTGWNYGYVGPNKPETPTLLDALGPFPLRVVWIVCIATAGFFIAWVPWEIARRKRDE